MKLLLDTHALLWSIIEPDMLSAAAHTAIADPSSQVLISAVSFWEISLKYGLGKLTLENVLPDELPRVAMKSGFELLPLSEEEAASFHRLPREANCDPFDRMLAWQAICGGMTLITRDGKLNAYGKTGLKRVW